METINQDNKSITLKLSKDELMILHNVLGEVLDGPYAIPDWELHALTGADKKEAEQLFDLTSKAYDNFKSEQD
jgi:hypothetical protein